METTKFTTQITELKASLINDIEQYFIDNGILSVRVNSWLSVSMGEDSFNHLTPNEAQLIINDSDWGSATYNYFDIETLDDILKILINKNYIIVTKK